MSVSGSVARDRAKAAGVAMTPQQAELFKRAADLADALETMVPSSTAHYVVEDLRRVLNPFINPDDRAFAGRVITKDVNR